MKPSVFDVLCTDVEEIKVLLVVFICISKSMGVLRPTGSIQRSLNITRELPHQVSSTAPDMIGYIIQMIF